MVGGASKMRYGSRFRRIYSGDNECGKGAGGGGHQKCHRGQNFGEFFSGPTNVVGGHRKCYMG